MGIRSGTLRYRGLSPRVRGNRPGQRRKIHQGRSIPACAGEPRLRQTPPAKTRVYPRVCGGTSPRTTRCSSECGLSPRVRGNRRSGSRRSERHRSIPACAGEPAKEVADAAAAAVYPRVCGGTAREFGRTVVRSGLSPRVRGNPCPGRCDSASIGSIPACAGEPRRGCGPAGYLRVYPRVCGGTHYGCDKRLIADGLSPRVRGNRGPAVPHKVPTRSIPACAGEPRAPRPGSPPTAVYPRVCGGTRPLARRQFRVTGLSPRVRGNPGAPFPRCDGAGSIPACAGEPPATVGDCSPG